ncbi:fumarylacetoacetate hydrolase family protein [Phaeobacter sp. S60]|uniref:fumarylacetoacetate hydrolase family protein n=1 Tax=Phaeobacter sp. S60 TaxID=1569353 RepID=UPI00058C7AF0|nr:fumarylacetoacetate hydrolase family protein [Phaeobacter sp. S60]KII18623.1 2-hydroxyhepta-2,4-diene-1,7-dioate isomerase [Phaeobacter sp. S60]
MKFATYSANGQVYYGAATDAGMIALSPRFPAWPTLLDVIREGGLDQLAVAATDQPITHRDVRFEMVLPNARRILCVGVNFPDRNAEYKDGSEQPKYMSLFPRFASGFTGHNRPLIRPPESHMLDYEGEVAIIIGKAGRRIAQADAYDHIAALTICNEGTIRDWVRHAKFNVTQGKNWDNSGAIGPWLVPFDDPAQLDTARIITRVNGDIRQDDVLSRMMHPIRREIEYISTFMTLEPGDVIVTGTPTGSGARLDPPQYLKPGDVVEVEVTGIGTLRNTIEDEQP